MTDEQLIQKAFEARKNSHSPYTKFAVGAAIECENGKVYTGCNIENAALGTTNCAERTALFKAVSEGERNFTKLALCGGLHGDAIKDEQCNVECLPCGQCRQALVEFCDSKAFKVIVAQYNTKPTVYTLEEMLPYAFDHKNLS